MNQPVLHYTTDRRCYNGTMCSDLQKELDSKENILDAIQRVRPDYRCTYFPMEGKYLSFINCNLELGSVIRKQLTGNMFEDKGQALLEAWKILMQGQELGAP